MSMPRLQREILVVWWMAKLTKALLPSAFLLMPGTVYAESPLSDVRCLLVSNVFANAATDPRARQAASAASAFYLGRIDDRLSSAALGAALVSEQKLLTRANSSREMQACSARLAQAEKKVHAAARSAVRPH